MADPYRGAGRSTLWSRARRAPPSWTARALLWYQGESDGGNETLHGQNFAALYADWHADFATIEQLYVERGRLEDVFRQLTGDEQGENA